MRWQYQGHAEPVSLDGERITPDKWQPSSNTPESSWQKAARFSLAAVAPAVFFVNTFPAPESFPEELVQAQQPVRAEQRQYLYPEIESKHGSFLGMANNRVTRYLESRPWPRKETYAHLQPCSVGDAYALTQPEATQLDKWFHDTARPRFDLARNQHLYPSLFLHEEPKEVAELVTADVWSVEPAWLPPSPLPRAPHLYPSFQTDPSALTQPETTQLDKWFAEASRPRFDVPRNQHLYPSLFLHEEPKEVGELVTGDVWFQEADQVRVPPRVLPHLYPSFFTDPRSLTDAETVSLDRWQQPQSLPRWDVPRNQFLFPPFATDSFALTQAESSTIDKWFAETQRPRFEVPRQQHTYPSFFLEPEPQPATEEILLDKWFKEAERPRFDAARNQHQYQSFFPYPRDIGTPFSIVSTAVRQTPIPYFDLKRTQYQ